MASPDVRQTKEVKSSWDTTIVKCPRCTQCYRACALWAKGGICMMCDYRKWRKLPARKLACDGSNCNCGCKLPEGFCIHCCTRLVAIGDARANGAQHGDWPSRRFHKKCWKWLLQRDELDDEDSDEG